jgi:predicted RNase H-like HicB family nuclease
MKYSILIQWSEEDGVFIASLPEWGAYAKTHGETYELALQNAKEVLEDLIYGYEQMGKQYQQLPYRLPKIFDRFLLDIYRSRLHHHRKPGVVFLAIYITLVRTFSIVIELNCPV